MFSTFRDMAQALNTMSENDLRQAINFEVSAYGRKIFIRRMHQKYCRMRATRERKELLQREGLL